MTLIDGKALFESSAVCTYIADHAPSRPDCEAGQLGQGEHDQWVSYALTEMEAWSGTRSQPLVRRRHRESIPVRAERQNVSAIGDRAQ